MLNISICDSDNRFIEQLSTLLWSYLKHLHTDWKLQQFHSMSELAHATENDSFQCDLLFIDISLKEGNNFNMVQYISRSCPGANIVFVIPSSKLTLDFDYFPSNAYAYILKPMKQERIEQLLSRYLSQHPVRGHCLDVTINAKNYNIPLHSVLYIEGHKHQVIVHTEKQNYQYYQSLRELEKKLRRHGFIRCHKSYIVSPSAITHYTASTIYCHNLVLPIGRTYKEQVRQILSEQSPSPYSIHTADMPSNPEKTVMTQSSTGALICIEGLYMGAITHFYPNQPILIGRDGECVDFVLNLPQISRIHCELIYHAEEQEYQITDYSSNGTFTGSGNRLAKEEPYLLKSGTSLYFGDKQLIYQLG